MKESVLRDLIAGKIHKLKPGLTLLNKEQYIPAEHGTRSFIDLYATDEEKRHVLIELKRSNAAARQAIHEVNKYIECVKKYFGAKDPEVHVIIASTEWTELLLPFSRFYADAGFSVEGIQIVVTEDQTDFQAQPITPMPVTQGRFIAPWHNVYWYADKDSFQRGITSIEKAYRQKGIDDYIIAKFHLPDPSMTDKSHTVYDVKATEISGMEKTVRSLPVNEYIAYTAVQMLPTEKCLQIISNDKNMLAEAEELLPDMEEEQALCYLHESVETVCPVPEYDYYEIGYPAKFSCIFEHEDCTPLGIERRGIFLRNTVLDDEVIYSELRGYDGSTGQKFKKTVRMDNPAHVKSVKENLAAVLDANPVWRTHISRIIEEISVEFPGSEIDISIFNPCTGIFTFFYALTREGGFAFLPEYHIIVKNPKPVRMYFGALGEADPAKTFAQFLDKYYDGDIGGILLAACWGGRDERDSDMLEDLGARYRSFWADISEGEPTVFFTLRDDKWRSCDPTDLFELFETYLEKNQTLMEEIVSNMSPHFFDAARVKKFYGSNADDALEKYVDTDAAEKKKIYYAGAPDVCDICKRSLANEKFMIDGKIKDNIAWANMCAACFCRCGVKIEWGYGQLYQKNETGWLLVGGFCPDEEFELWMEEND